MTSWLQRLWPPALEQSVINYRWEALARYNGERDRGIVHTEDFKAHMAEEQAEFNAEMERKYKAHRSGR